MRGRIAWWPLFTGLWTLYAAVGLYLDRPVEAVVAALLAIASSVLCVVGTRSARRLHPPRTLPADERDAPPMCARGDSAAGIQPGGGFIVGPLPCDFTLAFLGVRNVLNQAHATPDIDIARYLIQAAMRQVAELHCDVAAALLEDDQRKVSDG